MDLDKERKKLDGKGEEIRSHAPSDAYRDGWERIFGKKKQKPRQVTEERNG